MLENFLTNKDLEKYDKWLCGNKVLLTIQKQNVCFSIKLLKIVNLVLRLIGFLLSWVVV